MSNKEVIELVKTKYGREVVEITCRKFKVGVNLTKRDFLEHSWEENHCHEVGQCGVLNVLQYTGSPNMYHSYSSAISTKTVDFIVVYAFSAVYASSDVLMSYPVCIYTFVFQCFFFNLVQCHVEASLSVGASVHQYYFHVIDFHY